MDDFYYVYEDDQNDLYYYSAKTKESTYIKPKGKIFLDPETNETYIFKPKNTNKINKEVTDNKKKNEEFIHESESTPKFPAEKTHAEPIIESKSESNLLENNNYYFVYKTPENILYYYNCATQETTYTKPINGEFFDPNTKLPYIFDDSNKKPKKNKNAKLSQMDEKQAQVYHGRQRRNDIIPFHNITPNRRSTSPNLLF